MYSIFLLVFLFSTLLLSLPSLVHTQFLTLPNPYITDPLHAIPTVQRISSMSACRTSLATCLSKLDKNEPCDIIPTPRRLLAPPLPPGTFKLSLLRPGVFLYEDGAYLTLIIFRRSRLALVDFPDSGGSNTPNGTMTLLTTATDQVLAGATPSRIDMIYSHAHFDHIGAGVRFFNYAKATFPGVPIEIWAAENALEKLKKSTSNRAPLPTALIGKGGRTLEFGRGFSIRMDLAKGHTQSDLLIHIPRTKKHPGIAMRVDIIFPGWSPYAVFSLSDDVGDYIDAHKQLLTYDFEIFVGGHPILGKRTSVHRNLKFVRDIVDAAADATASLTPEKLNEAGFGKVSDPKTPEFGNIWYAFLGVVRKIEVRQCYRAVLEKWGCKLAGIDSTLESHCFAAVQYNFQDV